MENETRIRNRTVLSERLRKRTKNWLNFRRTQTNTLRSMAQFFLSIDGLRFFLSSYFFFMRIDFRSYLFYFLSKFMARSLNRHFEYIRVSPESRSSQFCTMCVISKGRVCSYMNTHGILFGEGRLCSKS